MISAREALALPTAKLSPSDAESVESLLASIEAYVRAHMPRHGFFAESGIEIDPTKVNGSIVLEIERRCRLLKWNAQFQRLEGRSALSGGMVVQKFQLALTPMDEAYTDDVLYQSENQIPITLNGVSV